MAKPRFRVQPQRQARPGLTWLNCEPHQARRWAVLRGKHFVTALGTKLGAELAATSLQRNAEGPPRHYTLGKRMPKRDRGFEIESKRRDALPYLTRTDKEA